MRRTICACAGTLSLIGCAGVEVREDNTNHGIPFYVKVPVLTQETQRARNDLTVRFKVIEASSGKSKSVDLPVSGPLPLPGVTRAEIDEELDRIHDKTYGETIVLLKAAIDSLQNISATKQAALAKSGDSTSCNDDVLPVLSNSWSVSMVADTKPHYIVTKQPLFGSSTANFEFGADGTMTKSNVTVTDDTAKTLLALLPIYPLLSKRWNVNGSSTSAVIQGFPGEKLPPKPPAKATQTEVRIEVLLATDTSVITLRKVSAVSSNASISQTMGQPRGPLSYCFALKATDDVQLISIARPDAGKSGDKSAGKNWQIQGTVTPPKAADSAGAADK